MKPEGMNFVLWGSAGHAKVLADLIRLKEGRVSALFDNSPTAKNSLPDVPLFRGRQGFADWLQQQSSVLEISAAIAIGGNKGADRQEIMRQFKAAGLRLPNLIHPTATVAVSAKMGEGCQILAHAILAPDVCMGAVCIINHGASVDHECKLENGVHVAPGAVLCGCVQVGENSMIGAGAVVLPRISIGQGALVGAGAVVTRNVPDRAVVFGNPAEIKRGVYDESR
jgi:sugar O-acyltransferase (sialic acid O-acetyltransferase NeuD family)